MNEEELMAVQSKALADWVDACLIAEEYGDETPYPIFLTVDEYIGAAEGRLEYH